MHKRKKILFIFTLVLLTLIISVSYSFYNANIRENNKTETIIKTKELNIIFTGTNEINANNMIPGDIFTKTFSVENTTDSIIYFNIYMDNITNEFNEDLVYTLKDNNGVVIFETKVPSTKDREYINNSVELKGKEIKEYILTIEYKYLETEQDYKENALLKMTLGIDTINVPDNSIGEIWEYDYSEKEEIFLAPTNGKYLLETWGAQGGTGNYKNGGYGGYTKGIVNLLKSTKLYITVGGQGMCLHQTKTCSGGGYNGGGCAVAWADDPLKNYSTICAGGGATHIATTSGLLNTLEKQRDKILIVSGGGGGSYNFNEEYSLEGGAAGGYIGSANIGFYRADKPVGYVTGGTQNLGGNGMNNINILNGSFGTGGGAIYGKEWEMYNTGGGAGFFGGGGSYNIGDSTESGGGGSSYIGNNILTEKIMYCYNCQESEEESTKTVSTTDVSESALSNYAKIGNGYAKITYLGK